MKPKVFYQIQPREVVSLRTEQVQEEIQSFLEAVDSYPARAAKEPGVSFHQHLCSIFAARNDRRDRPRPQ
jgi:sugar-specific transcriptional regulator TrmB